MQINGLGEQKYAVEEIQDERKSHLKIKKCSQLKPNFLDTKESLQEADLFFLAACLLIITQLKSAIHFEFTT